MDKNSQDRDPLPGPSAGIDEIVEFWDSPSTVDYEDQTEEVSLEIDLEEEVFTVALVPELVDMIEHQARARGVATETLVNLWLAEKLQLGER